jgi:hypothetical protein
MRGLEINIFKRPDKMKLGKICLVGDIVEIDLFSIVPVNEKLRLHQPPVKIYFGIGVIAHIH